MSKKTGVITILAIIVLALLFWIVASRAARADESRQTPNQCAGCNFSHVDWHGLNLAKARFEGDNFEGGNLSGVNFRGAPFDVNLEAADLRETQIEGSDLRRARLEHADLQGSSIAGVDARADDLSNAKLDDTKVCSRETGERNHKSCVHLDGERTYSHADLSGARL